MTGATHVITSVTVAAALGFTRPIELIGAAVGSLICDIDRKNSLFGRFIPILPRVIEATFGKRTITHSIVVFGLLALIFGWIYPSLLIPVLVIGVGSHLILDLPTGEVALFYPLPKRYSIRFGIPPVFIESFFLMGIGVFYTLKWHMMLEAFKTTF